MFRKFISLILAVSMLFCLSACEMKETNSEPNNTSFELKEEVAQDKDENNSESSETKSLGNVNQNNSTNQSVHTHSYSDATCTLPQMCSCGEIFGVELGHQFSSATCTNPQICSRCGITNGNALGHKFSEATCTKPKTCVFCGLEAGISIGHDFSDATCTSPQICTVCGTVNGKELGHSYNAANCILPETCSRCNSTRGSALGHDFQNEVCTRCGKLDRTYLIEDIESCREGQDIRYNMDPITDNLGKTYSNHYSIYSVQLVNNASIDFYIEKKFTKFLGTAFLSYDERDEYSDAKIYVYGDGKLLFQSTDLTEGCQPNNFEIDVTGVSKLTIEFENDSSSSSSTKGYLTNAYLKK